MRIVVIGGGPAGSTAALSLARFQFSVVIIEHSNDSGWKVGESLHPATKVILQRLGIWEQFTADGHLPSYGNRSAWGTPEIVEHDFIFNPHGTGWHLDRRRFDTMLANAAVEAGAIRLCRTKVENWQRTHQGNWQVDVVSAGQKFQLQADWIIDASGRASYFAQRQEAKRQVYDRLVGVVAFLSADTTDKDRVDHDSFSFIEAVPEGWWYSALLPDGKLVVVYMSDGDLISTRHLRTAENWKALLRQAHHTCHRVNFHQYRLVSVLQIVSANSSRLNVMAGPSWLAAGDAATAYDPLSSQGITAALVTGFDAATAIQAFLRGEQAAFEQYTHRIEQMYTDYLLNRTAYYTMEQRWPTSPFWQRRFAAQ